MLVTQPPNSMSRAAILLTLLVVVSSCGGPRNYDQCILDKVKSDMNESAVSAVSEACRNEFPAPEESEPVERDLPASALSLLSGQAKAYEEALAGDVYNGSTYTVTEITISFTNQQEGVPVTREYVQEVYLEPQTTFPFFIDIISGDSVDGTSWYIASAKTTD